MLRRVRVSLFRKYVALFLAVVCLALLISGTFGIWFSYREHRAALARIQREQAIAAAAKIGQFIKEIEAQLGWITQSPWSAGDLKQRIRDARRLLRQVPAITDLAELDSAGRERLRVSRVAINVIGSQKDYSQDVRFLEASARKVYYGPVNFRRETEPYLTLALAGTQRDAGVSIADVNLKLIWDVVSQIKVGEGGYAYVVDAEGRLIAHPDISLVLGNMDLSQLSQVRAARAGQSADSSAQVQVARDLHQREVLSASALIAPLGWRVFVELPLDEAYAPLYAQLKREGALLLAGLALASLAGLFLAGKMVGPIRALRAGAERIGRGDLGQRISIRTGDELEALAEQFNDMASRLQESYADLESKVENRTVELEQKSRQLELASQQKSRFLAAASHDLRQPLHALALYTEALKLQAGSGAGHEVVAHIDNAVAALSALVESFLDISRLDAGVVQPAPQPVAVRALLERIETGYRAQARDKGLGFRVEAIDATVHTDPLLLERVLRNLVDNAFKYTPAGSVTVRAKVEGSVVRLAVLDTGAGIPEAERERIFEEFYQIGNPERDRARGLGLGLAIVRRLAQLLGLNVELDSEPGRGSIFSVIAPLATGGPAAMPPAGSVATTSSRALAGARILVIDDEPEVRGGMTMLLEHLGCRVSACGDYAEAEQLLERQPSGVDLIIADFRLRNNESGIDAVRRLRLRLGDVPVLLLTGDTAPERLKEAQSSGLSLLHKPVSRDRLTRTMLAALQR